MDIAPITPSVTPGLGATTPIAPTQVVAIEQAQSLSFLPVAPTTVDLSTQGSFLSLATLFQKKTLQLQASVEAESDTPQSLADVSSLAQALTTFFNELQTAPVDNSGLPAGSLGQQSLSAQFLQQFGDPADETQANLGRIGVKLDNSPLGGSSLNIDQAALNDAFARDPAGTSNLLVRTGNAFFGVISAQVLANTGNIDLFADDEVSNTESLGLPDVAATPALTTPPAAPNVLAQSLVADTVRNGNELPDDRANGITLPGDVTAPAAGVPSGKTPAVPANATVQAAETEAATQAVAAQIAAAQATPPLAAPQTVAAKQVTQAAAAQAASQTAVPLAVAQTAVPQTVAQAAATPATTTASEVQTQDQAAATDTSNSTSKAAKVEQEARDLAQQLQAERTAARELDERIANASDEVRAALARDVDKHDAARIETLQQDRLQAQQRTAREDQERADLLRRDELARENAQAAEVLARAKVTAPAEPAVQVQAVVQPPPVAPNQAQQLARDPSTAAAIAAYNLNNGPFAAQNVRADVLAPKVKLVPPVASVPKAEPVAALDTSKGGQQSLLP